MGYFASTTSTRGLAPIADTHLPPAPGDPTGTLSGTITDDADRRPGGAGVRVVVHRPRHGRRPGAVGDDGRGRGVRDRRACRPARTRCCACVARATSGQRGERRRRARRRRSRRGTSACCATSRRRRPVRVDRRPDRAGLQRQRLRPGGAHRRRSRARLGHDRLGRRIRPAPKEVVIELAAPTNLTGVEIDPSAGCGDDDTASLGQYEVQASTTGAAFTTIASGTFTPVEPRPQQRRLR